MNRPITFLILLLGVLFVFSCDEPKEEENIPPTVDNIPPTVTITSPVTGTTVNEIVTITCISTDNEGVEKVELIVDGISSGIYDYSYPYELVWNTTSYSTGEHSLTIKSYDINGNTQISDQIILMKMNPFIVFNKIIEIGTYSMGYCIQQTNDRGYIILGTTDIDGKNNICLIKTDSTGGEIWRNTLVSLGSERGFFVTQTSDNGYILTGHIYVPNNGSMDLWLIKTNSQGNEEWNKIYGGIDGEEGYCVKETNDGGYIVTGIFSYDWGQDQNVWLIKTDSHGNEEWIKSYSRLPYNYGDRNSGHYVIQTLDGGYIITGKSKLNGITQNDVWLIKTDSQGNEEWNNTFGGTGQDRGESVKQTQDGGFIICGSTSTYGNGDVDVWLIKTDSQGNEDWNKTFGNTGYDRGMSLDITSDNGFILVGYKETQEGDFDVWLIKTDSQGNEEWNKSFGGSSNDFGYSVQQTIDGGYVITGSTELYGSGSPDIWLIKTDTLGNTSPY